MFVERANEDQDEIKHTQQQQEVDINAIMKQQWTEEEDNVLINNYEQFKDLGIKKCFIFMSQLLEKKSPKQCFKRAKILKLIKHGATVAREISQQLNLEKAGELTSAKVAISLKQFMT